MVELKCPFCGQEVIIPKDDVCFGQQRYVCRNPKCEFDGWHLPVKLVSELDRTRKALEVAKDTIIHTDWFFDGDYNVDAKTMHNEIKCAITALEQKDK